jgi:hypothetical protein
MGIYKEPLERTLEYFGLSMSKDQAVNTSIDGEEGVKRALIPGHLLNAKHWFQQQLKNTLRDELRAKVGKFRADASDLESKANELEAALNAWRHD